MTHLRSIFLAATLLASAAPLHALANEALPPEEKSWSFDGITGHVDRPSAQRGLQVYKEVCSACHSLKRVSFRSLSDLGFSEAEIKALAASYTFQTINDKGESVDRPGLPSDNFPGPYTNENAARASNNGAYPPDQSLLIKARHDGPNYIHSLLNGYQQPPAGMKMGPNMNYNPYFPGGQIAMAKPLSDGQVTYEDGTTATVDQMSRDVVNFLQWTAEPEMEARKRMGIKVMLFLLVTTAFFWVAKKRVWKKVKSGEV